MEHLVLNASYLMEPEFRCPTLAEVAHFELDDVNAISLVSESTESDIVHSPQLVLVRRDRSHLSVDDFGVPVVDYLRRDKRNTIRPRGAPVGYKREIRRPRYINALILSTDFVLPHNMWIDLVECDAQGNARKVVGRSLPYEVQKAELLRICVDCIKPDAYTRSEVVRFELRSKEWKLAFVLKWWQR